VLSYKEAVHGFSTEQRAMSNCRCLSVRACAHNMYVCCECAVSKQCSLLLLLQSMLDWVDCGRIEGDFRGYQTKGKLACDESETLLDTGLFCCSLVLRIDFLFAQYLDMQILIFAN